jgi:glutaredoxin
MRQPNITVYGSRTCPDTSRATNYLDSHHIPYEFKDLDISPELNEYVADLNGGTRVLPTIRVDDNVLINPDERALAEAVG